MYGAKKRLDEREKKAIEGKRHRSGSGPDNLFCPQSSSVAVYGLAKAGFWLSFWWTTEDDDDDLGPTMVHALAFTDGPAAFALLCFARLVVLVQG